MSTTARYAIFLHLRATGAWLRLPREERRKIGESCLGGALQKCPALRTRHFDAEAFHADCSDIMMIETADLVQYYDFIEMLRDSPLVTTPYFEFVRIITTVEDGYRGYEERAA
jgi:hypothetical protein